ncbi:hypothetical protein CF326_g187 [Tilletia indica]|nr:hypothetical protein CF326_g187 [Tilletia indica]
MSSRKRDLIERVKYPNPLPLPPYPPKLLNLPLAPERYAHPSFGNRLASELPIPLLADAEAGIHIDLPGTFPGIWLQDPSTYTLPSTVGPPEINLNELDPTDAFLLQDFSLSLQQPSSSGTAVAVPPSLDAGALKGATDATAAAVAQHMQSQRNAALGPLARTSLGANDVTWLRRTEYLSAEAKRQRAQEIKQRVQEHVDISREAQIKAISQTFKSVHSSKTPITSLRHPTKPGVHALEAYDVLPDPETWATDFNIVRFLDWPGRTSKGGKPVSDPRLDVHLLRPHGDQNQIISVYMPSGEFGESEVIPLTEEEIEAEYEQAKNAAADLPEEPSAEDGQVGGGEKEALEAAETNYKTKMALYKYINSTRSTVDILSKTERENLAAARFAKRRRTGFFPEDTTAAAQVEDLAEEEGAEENPMNVASKAASTTKFVHVRDYEPSAESGAAAAGGAVQLVFVFDDGKPDGEVVGRMEEALEKHGLEDGFPGSAQARYSSLDIVETDGLTGAPKSFGIQKKWKTDTESAPPQSRVERAYRAKLAEQAEAEEEEQNRGEKEVEARGGLKAAFYHPVRMNFKLRMKRYKKSEKPADQEDFWDAVEIAQRHLTENEVYRRLALRKDIDDLDRLPLHDEEEEIVLEEGEEEEEDAEGEVDLDVEAEVDVEGGVEGEGEGDATLTKAATAGGDDEEEEEEEEEEGAEGGAENGGDEEDDDDDGEEEGDMDDDELAALRADAAQNGEEVGGEDDGEGRSRRSRRG